jgi:endonuclease/exonuclease/phosphatase family metal-dependent hydrolase
LLNAFNQTLLKPEFVRIGFFFSLNIAISVLTLFLYYSPYVSPSAFWPSAFLPMLIPLFIILNFLFFIFWGFKMSKKALLSLIVLIIGTSFILRSYGFHFNGNKKDSQDLRVLSYNVRVFNVYEHLKDPDFKSSKNMLAWVESQPAEVICLQEFYTAPSDTIFNAVKRISTHHPYYNFTSFFVNKGGTSSFGMAIFSKLPIVNKGALQFAEKTNNQILFADIKKGKDTVRIYNIHLQSMSLEEEEIVISKNMKGLLKKLKNGAIQRSKQIGVLNKHMEKCPFSNIIICGDLNDTPYSYSYQALKKSFNNSFEEGGKGFGFTYNGKLLLRIDNQFVSKNIQVESFKVYNEIKYSDHFPVEGIYSLN